MKSKFVLIPLCLALTAGCGGSHAQTATTSDAASPAASMGGDSMTGGSMTGGSMSGASMSGSMSGHHHHHRKEGATSADGADTSASSAGAMSSSDSSGGSAATSGEPAQFTTESAAAAHCPSDTVVWLNLKSKAYHPKSSSLYGNTKHGAYVCETEANAAGDHLAK